MRAHSLHLRLIPSRVFGTILALVALFSLGLTATLALGGGL